MPAAASPQSTDFHPEWQTGQMLAGCYILSRRIEGAPGRTIWIATDEVLGKDVALHFLPQELVGRTEVAERLKQEVKRNRPLIHPHILRTYDFIEEEGWSAISTDAFEGPTLAGRLEDGAREVGEIEPWVEQICKTLEEAHRIRIVHAGLTPNDITFTSDGKVRLMNFGISAVIRDALRSTRSEAGSRALSYASPDQIKGEKPTVGDDIYALGAVVHELLAGEAPFQGEERSTPAPTIAGHRNATGHRGDPVPASWENAVSAALAADASLRPASASKWLEMAGSPIESAEAIAALESSGKTQAHAAAAEVEAEANDMDRGNKTATPAAFAAFAPETPAAPTDGVAESREPEAESSVSESPVEAKGEVSFAEVVEAKQPELPAAPAAPAEPVPESVPSDESAPSAEAKPEVFSPASVAVPAEPGKRVRGGEQPDEKETRANAELIPEEIPSDKRAAPSEKREAAPNEKAGSTIESSKPQGAKFGLGKKRQQALPMMDPDELAEQVRREEQEEEARQSGYFNEEEEYIIPRRGGGGKKGIALPLIGAAVALLILVGVIRMLVGTPEISPVRPESGTAGAQPAATTTESSTGNETPASATPVPVPPSDSGTNVATLPEPLTNPADPPAEAATTQPAETEQPAPAKTAAQEHEEAVAKVQELETKIAAAKKEVAEKTKILPQMTKGADESAAQQKKREEEAAKAEQAALQAEKVATEKRRLADEAQKTATALAEQTKTRREDHTKAQEAIATLQTVLREDEAALAEAKAAAKAVAERRDAEIKSAAANVNSTPAANSATAPAPSEATAPPATTLTTPEPEESEESRARNAERKRIDEEMAEMRRKLAEQAQKLGNALNAARSPEPQPAARVPATPAPQPPENPAGAPPVRDGPELALNKTSPPSLTETKSPPAENTKPGPAAGGGEFMNSLGMKFVAVPGIQASFCIWPTRVRDFETFARSTGLKSTLWKDPGFKQGPEHPVVNVTWQEAVAFCKWLTVQEQKEGLIAADQAYRLPTDLEWSAAVGLSDEPGRTPEARDMSVPDIYPWGNAWPPPAGSGNYTGEETGSDVAIKGYDDGFPWTSPVGSFPANKFGLFDMGGNVWEWCMDTWNSQSKARVLRGASWYNGALKLSLLSSCRVHASPDSGTDNYGFRVVLAGENGKGKR